MTKPVCYFLVGPPCSGKSTWTKDHIKLEPNAVVLSTDQYIEDRAAAAGKTYGEVFADEIGPATQAMNNAAAQAILNQRTIIWDQTNMTVKSRESKLSILKDYLVVALVFEVERDELLRRNNARRAATGKDIPDHVFDKMLNSYQCPSVDEGFDQIYIEHFG